MNEWSLENMHMRPVKLKHNRIRRPFAGGRLLDEWQREQSPQDGNKAEEWVASCVEARNTNPVPYEGLSRVDTGNGQVALLRDVIESKPEAFLGAEHVRRYGCNPAVLVKILDSYSRLMIQVHPDKVYAKSVLNSDFGKTEAWYIIGGRRINGVEPYVLLGFKPGITKEKWMELFERQDVKAMENALHKILVKPGDAFYVEGGIPHAAGSGVFFMEIQEPTDITMRTERTSPMGIQISDFQLHQGVGFEQMFDCFHYDGYSREEILDRWQVRPKLVREVAVGKEIWVIPPEYTPYFSMARLEVSASLTTPMGQTFSVAVVLSGSGMVKWQGGALSVSQGDELFLPAALGKLDWECQGMEKLIVIRCYPPEW